MELAFSFCGFLVTALAAVRLVRSESIQAFQDVASMNEAVSSENESSKPQLFGSDGQGDPTSLLPSPDSVSANPTSPSQTVSDTMRQGGNILKLRCELFVLWTLSLCAVTAIVSGSAIYEIVGRKSPLSRNTIEALFAQVFLEGLSPLILVALFGLPSSVFVRIRAHVRKALGACGLSSRKYRSFTEKLGTVRCSLQPHCFYLTS